LIEGLERVALLSIIVIAVGDAPNRKVIAAINKGLLKSQDELCVWQRRLAVMRGVQPGHFFVKDCAADVLMTRRRAAGLCAVGEAPPGMGAVMTSSV
jgi:hypothetical protein